MVCEQGNKEGCIEYSVDVFIGLVVTFCCIIGSLENCFVLKLLSGKVFRRPGSGGVVRGSAQKCTNTTYWLLCNLAIADLGNLLLPSPFSAVTLLYGRYQFDKVITEQQLPSKLWYKFMINLFGWTSNLFVMVSILIVCVISVRRAVALYVPFKYNTIFTARNVYGLTLVSWLVALIFACLPFYVNSTHGYMMEYGNSIAYLGKYGAKFKDHPNAYLGFVFTVTILCVTIPSFLIATTSVMVVVRLYTRKNVQYKVVLKKKQKESEENAARTVTIIPIIFFICHSPVVFRITASFIQTVYGVNGKEPPAFWQMSNALQAKFYMGMMFHFVLLTLNSCLNPLVYLLGSRKMRASITQTVNQCLGRDQRERLVTSTVPDQHKTKLSHVSPIGAPRPRPHAT